jgi:uncharacterized small protein (TIGR04563 family)
VAQNPNDRRKRGLFLDDAVVREIEEEAERQSLSLSQVVQEAWRMALPKIRKIKNSDPE